jgi:hypothetical protein
MKARHIAIALVGAMVLPAATPVSGAESWFETTMKPLMAISLDAGGAHVVSYFLPISGACHLTMMIASQDSEATGAVPSRVQITVEPGRAAYFDDADSKAFRFTCLYHADAMNVVRIERIALAPAH